jgi:hypothetical protein
MPFLTQDASPEAMPGAGLNDTACPYDCETGTECVEMYAVRAAAAYGAFLGGFAAVIAGRIFMRVGRTVYRYASGMIQRDRPNNRCLQGLLRLAHLMGFGRVHGYLVLEGGQLRIHAEDFKVAAIPRGLCQRRPDAANAPQQANAGPRAPACGSRIPPAISLRGAGLSRGSGPALAALEYVSEIPEINLLNSY